MPRWRARRGAVALLVGLLALASPGPAGARPERIRPGHSYYSDEAVTQGLVSDIGAERNYEEVYQRYRYYEAIYDERERVVTFKEYRRGDVIRVERYRYAADGTLAERVIERPGAP
jgi:hypothetical protein